jgi:hypothetical protein
MEILTQETQTSHSYTRSALPLGTSVVMQHLTLRTKI